MAVPASASGPFQTSAPIGRTTSFSARFTDPLKTTLYEELARRLREMGLGETKVSISSKVSRGGFGATFFIATMKAIGRDQVNLVDV